MILPFCTISNTYHPFTQPVILALGYEAAVRPYARPLIREFTRSRYSYTPNPPGGVGPIILTLSYFMVCLRCVFSCCLPAKRQYSQFVHCLWGGSS